MYDFSIDEMLYRDYTSILDFLNGKLMLKGYKLRIWENLQHYVNNRFESDEARKIVHYSIGFLGGSPENTPSFYHIMSHIDLTMGVFYPQGGIRKVVSSIKEIAESNDAKFKFNEPVTGFEIDEDHSIKKVITNMGSYEADIVIVNADYPFTEINLLKPENQTYNEKYWDKKTLAPSAMVAYLGIDKEVDKLTHHNLFLDKDWEAGFETLFDPKKGRLARKSILLRQCPFKNR